MKSLRKKVAAVLFLLGTSSLLAQPATPQPSPGDTTAAASTTVLSVTEMRAQSELLQDQVRNDAKLVFTLQLRARKEKDVIKLNCVNDKLIQIKALENIVERARSLFEGATSDAGHAEQFDAIQDGAATVHRLREQAQVCAGEIELTGDTLATWDGPDIVDDPSKDLFPDDIEPPGYASPFN